LDGTERTGGKGKQLGQITSADRESAVGSVLHFAESQIIGHNKFSPLGSCGGNDLDHYHQGNAWSWLAQVGAALAVGGPDLNRGQ
jgi:hypothetical protein